MTEQEMMRLAKEAGMFAILGPLRSLLSHEIGILHRFTTLVAERERQACAKVCESIYTNGDAAEGWLCIAADKIRARGESWSGEC